MTSLKSAHANADLMRQAQGLATDPRKNFYDLARCLSDLYIVDPSLLRGLEAVGGMRRRRLYYLVQVGQFLHEAGIDKRDAENIGWTKLQIVAAYAEKEGGIDADHVASCLRDARQVSAKALPDVLRGRPPTNAAHSMLLYLTPDQQAEITTALLAFGATQKANGLAGKEAAMARIAQVVIGKL